MANKFLQIHTLTSYPATLLNRDDAGFAKRMPFGGAVRTRISSQCLKRHWRVFDGENSLKKIEAPESVRSRVSFEKYIVEPLVEEGVNEEIARLAAQKIVDKALGSEAKRQKAEKAGVKSKKKEDSEAKTVSTAQVTVIGRPELDYLCQLARETIQDAGKDPTKIISTLDARMKDQKELKKNIRALFPGSLEAGLGAALFGRMVTGDILARTDAAIHVAHAMTVHGQMTESDYFSAIDDLVREEGEQGSGHINASELTSGVYYGYVVVDVVGLVANLGDNRELAGDVVKSLVQIVAKVSPGAKRGSTAPYAYSQLVLVESGDAQPRTLQNAFLVPIRTEGDIILKSYASLEQHLSDLDKMYGKAEKRAHSGLRTKKTHSPDDKPVEHYFENWKTLSDLAEWAKQQVIA